MDLKIIKNSDAKVPNCGFGSWCIALWTSMSPADEGRIGTQTRKFIF